MLVPIVKSDMKRTSFGVSTREMQKSAQQLEYCSETRLIITILIPIAVRHLGSTLVLEAGPFWWGFYVWETHI
jgi:hypothetical protein